MIDYKLIEFTDNGKYWTYPAIFENVKFYPYGKSEIIFRFEYEYRCTQRFVIFANSSDILIIIGSNSLLQEILELQGYKYDYITPEHLKNILQKDMFIKLKCVEPYHIIVSTDDYEFEYKLNKKGE